MANIFNGLGTASAIIGMHNDSQDRKDRHMREKNIAAAGQVAAGGDTKRASEMLMATGDIEGANAFEQMANAREDRTRRIAREDKAEARADQEYESNKASRAILGEVLGGDQTGEAYQAGAARMAAFNPEMAIEMNAQGQALTQQQEAQFAQELVSGFAATPKPQRAEAMKAMAEQYKDQLDPDIYAMMTNDDPSDDTRAAIIWGTRYGADVSPLQAEMAMDQEEAMRKRIAEHDMRLEVAAKRAEKGNGQSPYYGDAINMEASERRLIMQDESTMLEDADAAAGQAMRFADAATRWIRTAERLNVSTDHMGGGAGGQMQRNREGLGTSKWNTLGGIAEEMVRMTRVPGSGVFTDADAERAQKSVLGAQHDWATNQLMERFAVNFAKHTQGRADYLRWARDTFGHAGGMDSPEARAVWDDYKQMFPLTIDGEPGRDGQATFENNPNYMDFKSYLGMRQEAYRLRQQYGVDQNTSAEDLNAELDNL